MTLCFADVESTGLDVRIHQPWELSYWLEHQEEPLTFQLPHTLQHADPQALSINGYHERVSYPLISTFGEKSVARIANDLTGVTLVGSNPAFDAGMIERGLGYRPWHHRLINVSDVAMILFDWDKPRGLADIRASLNARGEKIAEPDHTAEGDVRVTRDVYWALRRLRKQMVHTA